MQARKMAAWRWVGERWVVASMRAHEKKGAGCCGDWGCWWWVRRWACRCGALRRAVYCAMWIVRVGGRWGRWRVWRRGREEEEEELVVVVVVVVVDI